MRARDHSVKTAVEQALKKLGVLLIMLCSATSFSAQDEPEYYLEPDEYEAIDEEEEVVRENDEGEFEYIYDDELWEYEEDEPTAPRRERDIHEDVSTYGQSKISVNDISDEEWKAIITDQDYSEDYPEEELEEEEEEEEDTASAGDSAIWRWLLICLIAGVFVYLIVKLTQDRAATNLKVEDLDVATLDKAEEHLHESDLEGLLQRAIDSKDYRSALRLRYLIVLRQLDANKWIEHLPAKTSLSYIIEMDGREQQATFRELSRIFDYVWYAEVDVPAEDDRMFARRFSDYMKTING